MSEIQQRLSSVVRSLSDQNYEQSLAFYRLLLQIGLTHSKIAPDQILDDLWNARGSGKVSSGNSNLFHPTAHLVIRFASDAESDPTLAPYTAKLQSRLCTKILGSFFETNMECVRQWQYERPKNRFVSIANLVARWANIGYVEESAIRNHILQSFTFEPLLKLHDHQADALIILFKIAGATFEAYADPSVVDRCFELLKDHYGSNTVKGRLVQVRVAHTVEGGRQIDVNLKEVSELRKRGWEGLPPPPVFATGIPKAVTVIGLEDPGATPLATTLGLPDSDLEPHVPHSPPLETVGVPESETTPSPPAAQSPSISIATLSDFEVADIFEDESPVDSTTLTPHDTFNFEDGNVEVLCGNTLFRVHTRILSLHSPALRQMFAQASLVTAESPYGCPRILSSDKATDFTTLLKMIYLPEYVPSHLRR
jgi:hypothetical protein